MARTKRKEKEREFKQLMIIDAAKTVFEQKGYYNTKIEDITAEAGFAKGSFYNYFECKKDLMIKIIVEKFTSRLSHLEKIAGSDISAELKLKSVIKTQYSFITDSDTSLLFKYFNNIHELTVFFSESVASLEEIEKITTILIEDLIAEFFEENKVALVHSNYCNLTRLFICYGKGVMMEIIGNKLNDALSAEEADEKNRMLIRDHFNFLLFSLKNASIIEKEIK